MHFLVVTPVFNGVALIDETILSVLTQAGPFTIRYHVQDGGSKDGTLEKLAAWKERLGDGFPILCSGVEFTYTSECDSGMYDAVNRGFTLCGDGDVMSWINADDRLEPGTFVALSQIFDKFDSVDWLCGRGAMIDEAGALMEIRRMIPFTRSGIAGGLYEGRYETWFIMQEATFWRKSLWDRVGGLDASYRLAGDFDLWRRFAVYSDLVVVNAIFGNFRLRAGQLSGEIAKYHQEIDNRLENEKAARQRAYFKNRFGINRFRRIKRLYKKDWYLENNAVLRIAGFFCLRIRTRQRERVS